MMRSLYSGITGLRNHQTRMDVIGNNIANVNTIGYKTSRVVFQDLYSQTLSSGSGNNYDDINKTGTGGVNPKQIGLGVTLSTIDVIFTPGANQYTGRPMDLCINDDGFFCINKGGTELYTRAGNFYEDDKNYLVTSDGSFVKGYGIKAGAGTVQPDLTKELPYIHLDPATYDVDSLAIGEDGLITAINRTTNQIDSIAYLKIATFSNTNGLQKIGGNYYRATPSSGAPINGGTTPGEGGAGPLSPGSIEMSNVDLAAEFVDMIVTQRGFQANSRTITTSDQMLEELVNLKR